MGSDIRKIVGQLFTVGFSGYSAGVELKELIEEYHLGGVIYFKKNIQSPGQMVELANELQFHIRPGACPPLFICIDHEGGRVNRLVKPFTKFPGIDHLGEMNSPKIGFEFGRILGKELAAVGINVNFAPVVDVGNPNSQILKSRTFSYDPEICAKMGSAVARGIQKEGVIACAKHFPGHGMVKEDSHLVLPTGNRDIEAMRQHELIPFSRLIRSRIEAVMTAHIVNEAFDPEFPATMSKKTLQGLLREELRFSRVIFSDDMEMKAIAKNYAVGEAAVLAIEAGCDNLIYKGETGVHLEAIQAVLDAVKEGRLTEARIRESADRIARTKKAFITATKPIEVTDVGNHIGLPEHFRLADIINRKEIPDGSEYAER